MRKIRNNSGIFGTIIIGLIITGALAFFIIFFIDNNDNGYILKNEDLLSPEVNENRIVDDNSVGAYNKLKKDYLESIKESDESTPLNLSERLSMDIRNELFKSMALDYKLSIEETSRKYNIPDWYLVGSHLYYGKGLETKDPPIPKLNMPLELYGKEIKKKKFGDLKYVQNKNDIEVVNKPKLSSPNGGNKKEPSSIVKTILEQQKYKNRNRKENKNPNNRPELHNENLNISNNGDFQNNSENEEDKYKTFSNIGRMDILEDHQFQPKAGGILQIPKDRIIYNYDESESGKYDLYNLKESLDYLAEITNKSIEDKNLEEFSNKYILELLGLKNSKILEEYLKKDTLIENLDSVNKNEIYKYFLQGDTTKIELEMYKLFFKNGFILNKKAVEYIAKENIDLSGLNLKIESIDDYFDYPSFVYKLNDKVNLNIKIEDSERFFYTYYIGNSVNKELHYRIKNSVLGDSNLSNKNLQKLVNKGLSKYHSSRILDTMNSNFFKFTNLPEFNKVKYYWQDRIDKITGDKRLVEGQFGEVGYKGRFPIFIQASGFNRVSKNGWKFNGNGTTLGKAGCSLFTLTSLVHAAGYENYNIPNTTMKPTIENMAKVFPNGPVLGTYVSAQGYNVKFRSTSTKKDMDVLFGDLKAGIPYAINVRRGSIYGYTKDGQRIKTEFTFGGHFLLFVHGFESNNRRWVEVVQSSRGNAGTKSIDQNQMVFDFDELFDKKIIRSSQGNAVPAYTITGGKGLPIPAYLTAEYKAPISVTNNEIVNVNENSIQSSEEFILRRNKVSRSGKSLSKVKSILDQLGLNISQLTGKNNKPGKGIKIINNEDNLLGVYEENPDRTQNLLIFIDYNNAIQITNLYKTANRSGIMKVNSEIGTTTDKTRVNFVIRAISDNWVILKSENIEVTEE